MGLCGQSVALGGGILGQGRDSEFSTYYQQPGSDKLEQKPDPNSPLRQTSVGQRRQESPSPEKGRQSKLEAETGASMCMD